MSLGVTLLLVILYVTFLGWAWLESDETTTQ